MQNNLDNIIQLASKGQILTTEQVDKFLAMVLSSLSTQKKDLEKESKQRMAEIAEVMKYIEKEHKEVLKDWENKLDAKTSEVYNRVKNSFDKEISKAKEIIQELRSIKFRDGVDGKDGNDGKDADETKIVAKVLKKLPKSKEYSAIGIKDMLESLENDDRLDFGVLKNVPDFSGLNNPIMAGAGGRLLSQMNDVDTTGITTNSILLWDETRSIWKIGTTSAGSGTVTSVSVASANGLAGSVANPNTTPTITLSTTVTGIVKGNGTAFSAAVANTDYQSPITLTTTGSSGAATFNGTTLNIPQYSGGGGGTPGGSDTQLQYNNAGSFGGITGATTNGTVVTLTSPIFATSQTNSYATASTIAIFDGSKNLISAATATYPSLTELSYVKGVTSAIQTQLNAKQATGNYITALTGDATASGPGSVALTLANVNSNVGSFTNANITVNAKGLITAASNGTAGTGDVVGPASATDNAIARFDSTTGKLIQNSTVTVDDSGNLVAAGSINAGSTAAATDVWMNTTLSGSLASGTLGSKVSLTKTGGTAGTITGYRSDVILNQTLTMTNMIGLNFGVATSTTGGVTPVLSNGYGLQGNISNVSGATITTATGGYFGMVNQGTGTTWKGIDIGITNSGTLTNTYGIYVGDVTSGTQTNTAYSIYTSDTNAINYLAGTNILASLTSNGLVTTSGGTGTLSITVPGTGVLTALAVNTGSAGAFVVNGGALGTPSSGVATNLTGTASGLTAGTVTTNANLTGDVTSVGNATTLATVNSNVGSFTNANITVNAKGLITAASNGSGGGGGDAVSKAITQTAHGFAVGDVLKFASSVYAKAQADSGANSEVIGIVSAVADANTFTITTHGYVSGLSGLTANTEYFLSASSAGALTATEPSTGGQVSKPIFYAVSTTAGYLINYRGQVIGSQPPSFVGCRVYQTGTTALTTSWVSCAFAAENFDTDTMHDNSSNNTRITINTSGKYLVGGVVAVANNSSIGSRVRLNGTTVLARQVQGNSNLGEGAYVGTIYDFTATDYIELQGNANTLNSTGDAQTHFWAYKIS